MAPGFPAALRPALHSGYEEFFGPMSGGVDYFTHCDSCGNHDLWLGDQEKTTEGYLIDLLSARAIDYVERMSRQPAPFRLSLHYTAPHWPWETRDDADRAPVVKDNLFDLSADERERPNQAALQPERLQQMRARWEAWNDTMPAIADDAKVSVGYSTQDMPQR